MSGFSERCARFTMLVLLSASALVPALVGRAWAIPAAVGTVAGFEIDGNLVASLGGLDWYQAAGGIGEGLLYRKDNPTPALRCTAVDPVSTRFLRDPSWAGGDNDITVFGKSSDKNDACIIVGHEPWSFKSGSGPSKNDLTEAFATVKLDDTGPAPTGHTFFIAGVAHRETNGDNHVDFEINARGLVDILDPGSTTQGITVGGPGTEATCGRTPNVDQIISVDFGNGGTNPLVTRHVWTETSPGVFAYVEAAVFGAFAAINTSVVEAPCDATQPASSFQLGPNYEINQFMEIAVDLTASGVPINQLCQSTTTLSIKSRSSGSFTAELKDRITFPFRLAPAPPCAIDGPNGVCPGSSHQYCGSPGQSGYAWSITGNGTISGPANQQCVTVVADGVCGSYTLGLTTGASGSCQGTCSQAFTVTDATAPTISDLPGATTIQCPANPTFTTPTATDDCDQSPTLTFADVTTPGSCPQNKDITRTWTARDRCGNSAQKSQLIHVVDTTAPVISGVGGAQTVQCPAAPAFSNPTASDACDPSPTLTFADVTTPGSCPQTYDVTRTWTARDHCGNSSTASQVVHVVDTTAPIVSGVGGTQTVQCPTAPAFSNPTASDACDPSPTLTFADVTTPGSCPQTYDVTRTWTARDHCGNSSTASQVVHVVDTTPPVISGLPGPGTVECPASPSFTTPTATDACDPNPFLTFTDATVPGSCPQNRDITRTWTATDHCGNSAQKTQFVRVVDSTAPVVTCPGNMTVGECHNVVTFQASGNDVCAGPVPVTCTPPSGSTFPVGTTPVTCTAQDPCGNRGSCSFTVTVIANPVCSITGPTQVAEGATVHLCAPSGYSCVWAPGGQTTDCIDVGAGTYTLTLTDKTTGCSSSCSITVVQISCACTLGYPDHSNDPRSSVVFNESEVLRAFDPGPSHCVTSGGTIKLWYNDEHALTLGVRRVVVKTLTGTTTTDYTIASSPATPTCVSNPAVGTTFMTGDQSGNDVAAGGGRPLWPALFVTDLTVHGPTSRAGDWQQGGTGVSPNRVCGVWKAAVRTVDRTHNPAVVAVTPDQDPAKNNWNIAGGDTPPGGFASLTNQGYGAECIWNVNDLGLIAGHTYRLQFMVHDGDQNKAGGDVGEGCTSAYVSVSGVAAMAPPQPGVESTVRAEGVEDGAALGGIELYRATPNPFFSTTRFAYVVPDALGEQVNIAVYDIGGRLVRTLISGVQPAGRHEVSWDGRSDQGVQVRGGVYFMRAVLGSQDRLLRIVYIR